eukprot:TRINITY_DN21712_c0_g1_i1.p1 TRINITY_DN21712_c0_g1~~TRINITY_DN21712_c0_g1_i1.p1  ORF type:complete len:232 (+),score=38.79 TRINITY_DN21712_c0_g1_i1:119-814(+)
MEVGSDPKTGFWYERDGEKKLTLGNRGRIYDAITCYPEKEKVLKLCQKLVGMAQKVDSAMPDMEPTHLLLLYYANAKGMVWHADDDENDGDNDHPIVSISIGNSCKFAYKTKDGTEINTIILESGDVLIWGGPERMLQHSVKEVIMDTSPGYLPISNVRLNFTFRDAPNILGQEDRWRTHKVLKYDIELEEKSQAASSNTHRTKTPLAVEKQHETVNNQKATNSAWSCNCY